MHLSRCRFCGHENPERAKFCNECGSPLYLKPCPLCDAVNDQVSEHCYQCGFSYASLATDAVELEAASSAADSRSGARAPTAGPGDIPEFLADPVDVVFARSANRSGRDGQPASIEVQGGEMARSHAGVDNGEPPDPVLGVRADRSDFVLRPSTTSKGAMLAMALLVVVIGSGYYAYRNDVALGWLRANPAVGTEQGDEGSQSAGPSAAATENRAAATSPDPDKNATMTSRSETTSPSAGESPASPPVPTAAQQTSTAQLTSAAPATHPRSTRPSNRPDQSAIETQRIISREMGSLAATPGRNTNSPGDRSAIETQRIISRETGKPANTN